MKLKGENKSWSCDDGDAYLLDVRLQLRQRSLDELELGIRDLSKRVDLDNTINLSNTHKEIETHQNPPLIRKKPGPKLTPSSTGAEKYSNSFPNSLLTTSPPSLSAAKFT